MRSIYKCNLLVLLFATTAAVAQQQGKVGINTQTPEATLDIKSKPGNTTDATKALEVQNGAGTKLATFFDDGKIGVGTVVPEANLHIENNVKHSTLLLSHKDYYTNLTVRTRSDTIYHPSLVFLKASGDGSYIKDSFPLGAVAFRDELSNNYSIEDEYGGAAIYSFTTENVTNTAKGANLIFYTTRNGESKVRQRMKLDHNGNLGVNYLSPKAKIHVVSDESELTPAIIEGCKVYANNAAATAAGVPVGGLYRKADGTLMVRY